MKVYEDCQHLSTDEIRQKYSQSFPAMKVDRVVFICSADDKLPNRLMGCVLRAARPSHHMAVRRGQLVIRCFAVSPPPPPPPPPELLLSNSDTIFGSRTSHSA